MSGPFSLTEDQARALACGDEVQTHPLEALGILFAFIFLMLGLTLHLTTRDPR